MILLLQWGITILHQNKIKKNETKVEYTFGYIRDINGNLRINLHHSSIPHSGH